MNLNHLSHHQNLSSSTRNIYPHPSVLFEHYMQTNAAKINHVHTNSANSGAAAGMSSMDYFLSNLARMSENYNLNNSNNSSASNCLSPDYQNSNTSIKTNNFYNSSNR